MVRMVDIVEPWRLFLLSSATLWRSRSIHGVVESTGAHGMRTCRPFASSAFGCECLLSLKKKSVPENYFVRAPVLPRDRHGHAEYKEILELFFFGAMWRVGRAALDEMESSVGAEARSLVSGIGVSGYAAQGSNPSLAGCR